MTDVSLTLAPTSAAEHVPGLGSTLAALPPAVAILFWVWVLVSVGVLIYRPIRRRSAARKSADPLPALDGAPPPSDRSAGAPPSVASASTDDGGAAAARSGPGPFFEAPRPAAPGVPAAPDPGRAGFFAASTAASGAPHTGAPRPSVADALSGIAMPCGLTPATDGSSTMVNPFRVAFLTTEADGQTVGAAIGDELERLGYTLTTSAATELLARRPGTELRVVLYPTPSAATRGLDRVFPVAPQGSVGIEFST